MNEAVLPLTGTSQPVQRWTEELAFALLRLPFNDLLFRAHGVHRENFRPNEIQLSTLLNIKSGGCPEDCGYCPQSARYDTGLEATPLMNVDEVLSAARNARAAGATRFCMGAAWRSPRDKDVDALHKQLQRELVTFMLEHPANITRCLHLMQISKRIERIADHATNIAEEVVFLLEGRDIRHTGKNPAA